MDLFSAANQDSVSKPLAEELRPKEFSEFEGQEELFKKQNPLIERVKKGKLQNLILWGPPGCGKTTFAHLYLKLSGAKVWFENAIDLGTKKIKEIGESGKRASLEFEQKTILFIDEIHRLNKSQQDSLLPFIERGEIYLVGATTENPSYELNSALISRSRVLIFKALEKEALMKILKRAFESRSLILEDVMSDASVELILQSAQGDARVLLNLVEDVIQLLDVEGKKTLSEEDLKELFSRSTIRFDKKGDEHYNLISSFIKSIRGSDPDAGLYYLARMIQGGEDPLFIARRLVILASEDVGNADPQALTLAVSGFKSVEVIGLPEAEICLAQVVTYLASAPKSNRSYMGIKAAKEEVQKSGPLSPPAHIRHKTFKFEKENDPHAETYKYPHNQKKGWVKQGYLPKEIESKVFYEPKEVGFEKRIIEYLGWLKN
jgi:putative ATPase